MAVRERLAELGLELPAPMHIPGQRFELVHVARDRATIAGHLPLGPDGSISGPLGKVGAEVAADEANQSARLVALAMLASLEAAGIDLERVVWRKVFGMVNAAPGFNALPGVINGFSDVLLEVFGERGRHSRSAVGVAELPFGAPVEVEAEIMLLPVETAPADSPPASLPAIREVAAPVERSVDDPGLRTQDYAGSQALSIPAQAIVRSIDSLSRLFWISIGGAVVTIFLAALANLEGPASVTVQFGEYSIPSGVLPVACLVFAMFVLWLTATRLQMLDDALADDDLTSGMARDIFRLDPPVLNVFDATSLKPYAMLSGTSVLLWIWSLFLGSSLGLIFSATVVQGAALSVDMFGQFTVYSTFALLIMVFGVRRVIPPLRRIHERLYGERLRIGVVRIAVVVAVVVAGVLATNPDLARIFLQDEWRPVGPSRANAIDGETLLLEDGQIVAVVGIEALRPSQTCLDAQGAEYACGLQAMHYLQSLVEDRAVRCLVGYPNLGLCKPVDPGSKPSRRPESYFVRESLAAEMVAAGFALAEGDAEELLHGLQNEAQRKRLGAWQGAFVPPRLWEAGQR